MAGRGGLNLTHSEDLDAFIHHYSEASPFLKPCIDAFSPADLRAWAHELGEETFVGSSGRVFPKSFKASPLLRAWQKRLTGLGVEFRLQHDWHGWDKDALLFTNARGAELRVTPDATLLALGGASWPRLGADGSWVNLLADKGVTVTPLRPTNCGFHVTWSEIFREKNAGQPLKSIAVHFQDKFMRGEAMIAEKGIEGGVIYALSAVLREDIAKNGQAIIAIDLKPDTSPESLTQRLSVPRRGKSFSAYLRTVTGLAPASISLINENRPAQDMSPQELAGLIKNYPLTLTAPFPLDRAISTAGGIALDAVDAHLMLKQMPGVFVAGEMLDWEAPTGGYLLQACFATGAWAANGITRFIAG